MAADGLAPGSLVPEDLVAQNKWFVVHIEWANLESSWLDYLENKYSDMPI